MFGEIDVVSADDYKMAKTKRIRIVAVISLFPFLFFESVFSIIIGARQTPQKTPKRKNKKKNVFFFSFRSGCTHLHIHQGIVNMVFLSDCLRVA